MPKMTQIITNHQLLRSRRKARKALQEDEPIADAELTAYLRLKAKGKTRDQECFRSLVNEGETWVKVHRDAWSYEARDVAIGHAVIAAMQMSETELKLIEYMSHAGRATNLQMGKLANGSLGVHRGRNWWNFFRREDMTLGGVKPPTIKTTK
jgi:hypothetical protein